MTINLPTFTALGWPTLTAPAQLFRRVTPAPLALNAVSQALQKTDHWEYRTPARGLPPLMPLGNTAHSSHLDTLMQGTVTSAVKEWQAGVRESAGSNRSIRIDQYARNAKFGPGYAWCGFFVAFNYSQMGFKYPESLASYQKARDFFMYRSYTDHSAAKNKSLDQLRLQHQQQGNQRQYFTLPESPNHQYVKNYQKLFGHYADQANTFTYQNLPLRPGDTVLYHQGHVGQVISYNQQTGKLITIEGNTSGTGPDGRQRSQAVVRKEYDLSKPSVRKIFDGFGRPALGDFSK